MTTQHPTTPLANSRRTVPNRPLKRSVTSSISFSEKESLRIELFKNDDEFDLQSYQSPRTIRVRTLTCPDAPRRPGRSSCNHGSVAAFGMLPQALVFVETPQPNAPRRSKRKCVLNREDKENMKITLF